MKAKFTQLGFILAGKILKIKNLDAGNISSTKDCHNVSTIM